MKAITLKNYWQELSFLSATSVFIFQLIYFLFTSNPDVIDWLSFGVGISLCIWLVGIISGISVGGKFLGVILCIASVIMCIMALYYINTTTKFLGQAIGMFVMAMYLTYASFSMVRKY